MQPSLSSERFRDEQALDAESSRISSICRSCRRCENLCPAFESLLGESGSAAGPSPLDRVEEGCFFCQRCLLQCPFAPPHPDQVDFPFLMLQRRLVRVRREGLGVGQRLLANPDLALALGHLARPFSGWLLRRPLFRAWLQRFLGLDRELSLPPFARPAFDPWFRKRERGFRRRIRGSNGRVALFLPCRLNYQRTALARKTVEVLHHNDVSVLLPSTRCCGRAALEQGDEERLRLNMTENLRALRHYRQSGWTVVVPEAACAWMLQREYPRLSRDPEAGQLAASTMELSRFLLTLHREERLRTNFRRVEATVGCHLSCHLRALEASESVPDLLALVPGLRVRPLEGCCSAGMVWGMKQANRRRALRYAEPMALEAGAPEIDLVVSDSLSAAARIEESTGRSVLHPVEVLHRAYGL